MIKKQQLYEAHADTYKIWIFTIYMTRKKNNNNNISFTRERNANDKNNTELQQKRWIKIEKKIARTDDNNNNNNNN